MVSTMERRTRDAERSKEAILNAAERLFAEQGYQATSLQDIGDAAGVSRGTPSYFFGSKEGLYRAVMERLYAGVGELVRRERADTGEGEAGPAGVFAREISAYIDFLSQRPNFVRLLQWEALTGGRLANELGARLEVLREAERVVREEAEAGEFRAVNANHLMINVIALCWFPFAQRDGLMRTLGLDPYDPSFVEAHKEEVVALVLDGLRCPTPASVQAR